MDEFPNEPQVIFDLATTHAVLGICLARLGETEKVIVEIQRAIELIDEGNRYSDARTYRKVYLADYLGQILGRLFKKTDRLDEAWGYNRPLGLTFGPRGDLFVGSRTLSWVLQFDVSQLDEGGGRLGRVFARGDGLRSPNGLAFGPDGDLYVCGEFDDCVSRYDGSTGELIEILAKKIRNPVGLTFGPDRNLYVSSSSTHQVFQYDGATGEFIDVFVQPKSGGLLGPLALSFGPDGSLFVASSATDAVLRYDGESGRFIDTFVSRAGLRPNGLTFGPKNRLFVSSRAGMRGEVSSLYCFDTKTRAIVWSVDHERIFTDVAYGPDDDLYVSCLYPDGVLRFDGETGKLIGPLVAPVDTSEKSK